MTRGLWPGALAVSVVIAACTAGTSNDTTLVAHRFDSSADGWRIAGDSGMADPDFHGDGGRAGGYISGNDEALGETWYFRAPASVLAALPAASGGSLGYSLKLSSDAQGFPDDDIVLVGPAGRLSYRFSAPPGDQWTDFSVQLSASDPWRWNGNTAATDEQIRSVLGSTSRLEIRGEYQTGSDEGGLDDFVLTVAD